MIQATIKLSPAVLSAAKLSSLPSADPMIQATIKDALYIMLLTYCN